MRCRVRGPPLETAPPRSLIAEAADRRRRRRWRRLPTRRSAAARATRLLRRRRRRRGAASSRSRERGVSRRVSLSPGSGSGECMHVHWIVSLVSMSPSVSLLLSLSPRRDFFPPSDNDRSEDLTTVAR